MSADAARVHPRSEPRRATAPRLRPVAAPATRRRPKLAYAALAVGGALAIGAAQMAVSLASTQDSFVLRDLTAQHRELTLQKQALNDELVALSSPQSLAVKADGLGLVVAGPASYLRLSDGSVLGAGRGADWTSTVNPNGAASVGNALLVPPSSATDDEARDSTAQDNPSPALPPAVTDGLPSPTTH
ncbi:hypothetical protein [Microbacterium sp.]|uniref:hypothetical protein n=1 Tax=Microbacterium sp. TaxID=51671 RepID=UPI0028111765|nr:hypothetical protein [Microbacterium sp.]